MKFKKRKSMWNRHIKTFALIPRYCEDIRRVVWLEFIYLHRETGIYTTNDTRYYKKKYD